MIISIALGIAPSLVLTTASNFANFVK
jgi:hypothetical protein